MRFIKLSPGLQATAAVCTVAILGWVLAASTAYLTRDARLAAKERQLTYAAGELDSLVDELERLKGEALARTRRLEKRQALLDSLIDDPSRTDESQTSANAAAEESKGGLDEQSFRQTPETPMLLLASISGLAEGGIVWTPPSARVSEAIDGMLDRLDAVARHQTGAARTLADIEKTRLSRLTRVIERVGVSPAQLDGGSEAAPLGMGGPAQTIATPAPEASAFAVLERRVQRRERLLDAARSIPSLAPADDYYLSSRFGPRRDPFTKRRSHHSGADLAGWRGETIRATAPGRVVKAGYKPAYGRMVEIDHGTGFMTRYGHMSRLKVEPGDRVERGQAIGEMGSSGRSTSTHLHWEVWFDGEPIDPLPFIKAAEDVYALQRRPEN